MEKENPEEFQIAMENQHNLTYRQARRLEIYKESTDPEYNNKKGEEKTVLADFWKNQGQKVQEIFLDEEVESFHGREGKTQPKTCAVIFGNCADIGQMKVPRKDEICEKAAVFRKG